MPKYVHRDGTTHDKPSTLDVCGVQHDTQILSEEEIIAILTEHFARQTGGNIPTDIYLTGWYYGKLGVMVQFGQDPHPIPF
jgi:hypothetical protein